MTFSLSNMHIEDADEMRTFTLIPAGTYTAMIVESDRRPTKDGEGSYVMFVFELLDEGVKGRKHWVRLNIENKSKIAVDIGRSELKAICQAVGFYPDNAAELHDKPIQITMRQTKNKAGELENKIGAYAPIGAVAGKPAATPAAVTTVKASSSPWKK